MENTHHKSGNIRERPDLCIGCQTDDQLVTLLNRVIRLSVRLMAILMALVIFWGVADVCYVLYQRLMQPPFMLLNISDILSTFGAFMAVLIAIEIFVNITMYLKTDVIHIRIVMATALMAIARKVIILDFKEVTPDYMIATGVIIFALSIGYWLITRKGEHVGEGESHL